MKVLKKIKYHILNHSLPIYWPKKNYYSENSIYLAIWNCGRRPQTFWQGLKDIRITIRRGAEPIFVIKKGSI